MGGLWYLSVKQLLLKPIGIWHCETKRYTSMNLEIKYMYYNRQLQNVRVKLSAIVDIRLHSWPWCHRPLVNDCLLNRLCKLFKKPLWLRTASQLCLGMGVFFQHKGLVMRQMGHAMVIRNELQERIHLRWTSFTLLVWSYNSTQVVNDWYLY